MDGKRVIGVDIGKRWVDVAREGAAEVERHPNEPAAMAALVAGSLFVPMNVRGQTQAYIVRQLSSDDAAAVPCKLNNLGDLAGRAGDPFSGATGATIWNHRSLHSKHFGKFFGMNESGDSSIQVILGQVANP